jgi:predicted MPP superfamily phosphohydrolase
MSGLGVLEFFKLAIFYASYLYFPAAAVLLYVVVKRSVPTRVVALLLLAPLTVLAYARFIEPRILLTAGHEATLARCFPEAGSARLAVFSDTHEGLFANAMPIRRIAAAINKAAPDAVFIAGDFVYFISPEHYADAFAALRTIDAPVFGVLGNHDVGLPGPDVGAQLAGSLKALNVHMLDNAMDTIQVNGAPVEIVGLSELWADGQDRSLLEHRGPAPRLILTHNPGTILELRPKEAVDLLLAGHTHGGQINIPGLTCALMPGACRVTRYGLADTARGQVFVTSGTGMVGLPMRFNAAPRIDVIELSWRTCD